MNREGVAVSYTDIIDENQALRARIRRVELAAPNRAVANALALMVGRCTRRPCEGSNTCANCMVVEQLRKVERALRKAEVKDA